MSSGGKSKKYRRANANTGMAKIMNLHYSQRGFVEPLVPLFLMHFGCRGFIMDRDAKLYTVDITTFSQKGQELQEPKPFNWGTRKTMALPNLKQGLG